MVEDPRINFAISTRGGQAGLNHLGLQVDSDDELRDLRERLVAADQGLAEESGAHCCYAVSDKYWVQDPQGIAWESYHTLGSIPVFSEPRSDATAASPACCMPATAALPTSIPVKGPAGCCR
jgi:lactoylglutathione lyase